MQIPNTFNINAKANIYLPIHSEEALVEALQQHKNPFVLGGGSNMLLTQDITQPVLHILLKGISIVKENNDIAKLGREVEELGNEIEDLLFNR